MGPFELMDLVGIDVGFEVAKSFTELSFGEPRWRPSPIQARMVAAGRLGRKTGRGYYEYAEDGAYRPDDPEPLEPGGGEGERVADRRATAPLADGLRERARGGRLRAARGRRRPSSSSTPAYRPPPRRPAARRCSCCAPTASLAARGEPGPWASTCCRR